MLVAVARRSDDELRCWSRQQPDAEWEAYPRGVRAALRDAGYEVGGADLLVDSDVPVGAGLSSSAALECAVALALLGEREVERVELARICQRAENVYVGTPTGLLDQLASLLGRPGAASLIDCRSLETEQVPLPLETYAVLVLDTKVSREVAASAYADRRDACERAARHLGLTSLRDASTDELPRLPDDLARRVRHVLSENERVEQAVTLLRQGRIDDIGPLLDASHASLRDDYEVSSPELDVAVEEARAAGALGARLTGAGFGGSAIALVPNEAAEAVAEAVRDAFARRGWTLADVFRVAASDGARRL